MDDFCAGNLHCDGDEKFLQTAANSESGNFASEMLWALDREQELGNLSGEQYLGRSFQVDDSDPSSNNSKPSSERAAKKRENDRAYRQKQKKGKEEMRCLLGNLTSENSQLNDENKRLKLEAEEMQNTLPAQAKQIEKLKKDLNQLKLEYDKQNTLIHSLSEICAKSPYLQHENQRLRIENDLLNQITTGKTDQQLVDELTKLKLENRILKVQNDALCGKILRDYDNHENLTSSV